MLDLWDAMNVMLFEKNINKENFQKNYEMAKYFEYRQVRNRLAHGDTLHGALMEISNLKEVNICNNAIVSLRSGRLALTTVNSIRNLKKDKEKFIESNENNSLLKELVLFDYDEEHYDDVKAFMNEQIEIIFGNEREEVKEVVERELNKVKEEKENKIKISKKIKESIDVLSQKNSEIQKGNVRQDTVKQIGKLIDEIMIVIHRFNNIGLEQQYDDVAT
jgi:hypothetical protein